MIALNWYSGFVAEMAAVGFGLQAIGQLQAAQAQAKALRTDAKRAEKNAIALGLTRHEYVAAASATQDLLIPLGSSAPSASRKTTIFGAGFNFFKYLIPAKQAYP